VEERLRAVPLETGRVGRDMEQVGAAAWRERPDRLRQRLRAAGERPTVEQVADVPVALLVDRAAPQGQPLAVLQHPQLDRRADRRVRVGADAPATAEPLVGWWREEAVGAVR